MHVLFSKIMCGIVGYIGKNNALPILIDGLKRLEYRGYDSSGVALYLGDNIKSVKAVGKIKNLEEKLSLKSLGGFKSHREAVSVGIAHTRWATHGAPSEANAHPHTDCLQKFWLVHNGIIENYKELKEKLEDKGHKFISETDTEVIAHLIEDLYDGDLSSNLIKSLKLLKGAYGIALMHKDHPGKILVAKMGSPLAIGLGDEETIIASDISAIIFHTKQVVYLDDGEIAEIGKNDLKVFDIDSAPIEKKINQIEWDIEAATKSGFPHFMLKEIFEQPESLLASIRGRIVGKEGKVKLGGLDNIAERVRDVQRIITVGCGTARHAGLVGEYMFEEYANIPVEVDYASEFRYRKPIIDKNTAVLAISQSGETADTLAAIREAREKGTLTLGIVNVVGSTIAREIDAGVYNHIGPEIAVASTKAFTSQLAILALMAVYFGRQHNMSLVMSERILKELEIIPKKAKKILEQNDRIKKIAEKYSATQNFAFLGRKYNSPVALEGALKLKEISYIHSEGFTSGEMKHGAIALIDENFPSLCIAPQDSVYEKNLSNIAEIKARQGKVIAIATEGDEKIKELVDDVIYIPKTLEMLTPILATIPLQLFAYHMAVFKGLDVDKPRNLAKSVTVE